MKKKKRVLSAIYNDSEALLGRLQQQVRSMRRFRGSKPHKLVMLLAVVDMMERGSILDGRVYFNRELIGRFSFYFGFVAQPTDSCRPHIPFFHLNSLGWWSLKPKIGRESSFSDMRTCHSARELLDNVECACISEEVYGLLLDRRARQALRYVISEVLGAPEIANISCAQTESKEVLQD